MRYSSSAAFLLVRSLSFYRGCYLRSSSRILSTAIFFTSICIKVIITLTCFRVSSMRCLYFLSSLIRYASRVSYYLASFIPGAIINQNVPISFFFHYSLCIPSHSLMKFYVYALILSSRVLSRSFMLLKSRRMRRIYSPVSISKWQKGRRRPLLSAALLKFLMVPN